MNELAILPPADLQILTSAENHPALVYLARLDSAASRRTMRHGLSEIARTFSAAFTMETLPWQDLRYQHTSALRTALRSTPGSGGRPRSPATVNVYLCALRGVLKECWRLGLMSAEDYNRAKDFDNVTAHRLPRGRALSAGETHTMFSSCANRALDVRDRALLAVLYGCGLRRSELVALTLADYNAEIGSVHVRHGKGDKERLAYLPPGGAGSVEDWLALRGREAGPLFTRVYKGGNPGKRPLSAGSIRDILLARALTAGVKPMAPHDLRRTHVSDLLARGADLSAVSKMVGHANVNTTAGYDLRGEEEKKKAAALLHIPSRGE